MPTHKQHSTLIKPNIKQHISAYNTLNNINKKHKNNNNNGAHTPASQHTSHPRRYAYTPQQLCNALQTYQLLCKTRQHNKKSMRRVAREYNIPWSTFERHVHKLHAQQQSIHNMDDSIRTQSTLNNNSPCTSDMPPFTLSLSALPPSTLNNNTINNNNSSLSDIHATYEMQHNSIDVSTHVSESTHIGPRTLFTSE